MKPTPEDASLVAICVTSTGTSGDSWYACYQRTMKSENKLESVFWPLRLESPLNFCEDLLLETTDG